MKAFQSGTFKVCAGLIRILAPYSTIKWQEGNTGMIRLKATSDDAENADDSCDEPEIVEFMIEYFYHFDYLRAATQARSQAKAPDAFFVEHARVFAMAIKYQAKGLRQLAAHNFKQAASKF